MAGRMRNRQGLPRAITRKRLVRQGVRKAKWSRSKKNKAVLRKIRKYPPKVYSPLGKTVAAVITAKNEEKSILEVIRQAEQLPLDELIVIVNGSNDGTFHAARSSPHAVILHLPEALGHDVGRSIGAKIARSDIVLFLDGDFSIPAGRLMPFIQAVAAGQDVVLNNITPYISLFPRQDKVTKIKQFFNRVMGRADLFANSLTAVPHALSRKALETIGYQHLMIPPKAMAMALKSGLKISAPASVDVISKNRQTRLNGGVHNVVADLIIGDHLEALQWAMQGNGERLEFPDHVRNRTFVGGG